MTRLLVVDDSADMRESMKLLLERAGYRVELAGNGTEALAAQRRRAADVLITDIFMPEADGLETIEAFKREFPQVKILAMSGGGVRVGGAVYLETARVAGADAMLRKPFEMKVLLQALQELAPRPPA
jgi:CheY-like chemotaxis protein